MPSWLDNSMLPPRGIYDALADGEPKTAPAVSTRPRRVGASHRGCHLTPSHLQIAKARARFLPCLTQDLFDLEICRSFALVHHPCQREGVGTVACRVGRENVLAVWLRHTLEDLVVRRCLDGLRGQEDVDVLSEFRVVESGGAEWVLLAHALNEFDVDNASRHLLRGRPPD